MPLALVIYSLLVFSLPQLLHTLCLDSRQTMCSINLGKVVIESYRPQFHYSCMNRSFCFFAEVGKQIRPSIFGKNGLKKKNMQPKFHLKCCWIFSWRTYVFLYFCGISYVHYAWRLVLVHIQFSITATINMTTIFTRLVLGQLRDILHIHYFSWGLLIFGLLIRSQKCRQVCLGWKM